MRVLKLALISFVILFLLVTAISLFIPSHIRISRATEISSPADSVMAQISQPLLWKNWYPGGDSTQIFFVNGSPRGLVINPAKRQDLLIDSIKTGEVTAVYTTNGRQPIHTGWKIFPGSGDHGVTVQWYMDFQIPWYPWEKFKSLLFEKVYGSQMERGLVDLKMLLEKEAH